MYRNKSMIGYFYIDKDRLGTSKLPVIGYKSNKDRNRAVRHVTQFEESTSQVKGVFSLASEDPVIHPHVRDVRVTLSDCPVSVSSRASGGKGANSRRDISDTWRE